jgi:hypothetical protein
MQIIPKEIFITEETKENISNDQSDEENKETQNTPRKKVLKKREKGINYKAKTSKKVRFSQNDL